MTTKGAGMHILSIETAIIRVLSFVCKKYPGITA